MINNELPKRLFIVTLGLLLCGIGIGILLFSNLGVDPGSVFIMGISKVFSISYGLASALVNGSILILVFFVDKKYINIASVMAMIMIGFTADYTNMFISTFIPTEFIIRFILIFVGCVILSLGIATYLSGDLGGGAIDLVGVIISDKKKFPYNYVRIAVDVLFLAVGFLLGGKVGVATIVLALLTGPLIQFFKKYVNS